MRRTIPSRVRVLGAVVAGAAVLLAGAADAGPARFLIGAKTKAKKRPEPAPPKVDETVGDVANILGYDVRVEGVGLVMGLDNTGSDPAPSWQRNKLVDEMRKAGVEHPERLLRGSSSSLVIVRATVPAGLTTKDKFDVEIELPPASATSSLAGGWLVTTQLAQRAATPEGEKDDKVIAAGLGPVMIGTAQRPGDPKVGRVLGGGRGKEDSPYLLSIKEARRSGKTSQLLENVIKQRFHQSEGVDNKGMAVAKTDAALVLKVPKTYHHNQDRYHQIIKYLSLVDNENLRARRLEQWGQELLDPKKAGIAAIKLEGLGPGASPVLKQALGSPEPTVRFFAAESLAYLNDGDGAPVLAETARKVPEFRSFALKAMAAMDQSASLLKLRALMAEPEYEVRYGAFDALRTLDPSDPFLGRVNKVLFEAPEADHEEDMAYQIDARPRRKPRARADEPFSLYVVDCEGPPMIHVSGNMRCEVVIFGKGQKLLTPVVLGSGGPLLLNASDGDSKVQITKITSKNLDGQSKVNSPLELAEVIREMASLGASYPDVVAVLISAAAQKNLPGPFVVDAIPAPNPKYDEAQLLGEVAKRDSGLKKTGLDGRRPNMFQRLGHRMGR